MLEKQLPYKHKVYEAIKKDILCGKYTPGYVLNERHLSEEMGISRTPVREALQMLAQDGWVQIETYKGAVVRTFDLKYIKELSRIRLALEVCAIEDAITNITDEAVQHLDEIQQAQQQMLDQFSLESYILLDREFHCFIYDLSCNQELIRLLRNYFDIFCFLGAQVVKNSEERRITTLQEHQAILKAIRDRNVHAAVQAMRYHLESTERNMSACVG